MLGKLMHLSTARPSYLLSWDRFWIALREACCCFGELSQFVSSKNGGSLTVSFRP